VLENIFLSLTTSMASLLYYERLFKRIPPFHDTFDSKYNLFREKMVRRHNIDPSYLRLLMETKEIIKEHKNSPVEFARKDKFVICSDSYQLRTISVEELKRKIAKAKLFIEEMDNLVSKNDGIFGRSG
jgi:hypothetical protein